VRAADVVQARDLVEQALFAGAVGIELGADVRVEAQRQLFAVERRAQEVPRARTERREALLAARVPGARDENRGAVRDTRVGAELTADFEPSISGRSVSTTMTSGCALNTRSIA